MVDSFPHQLLWYVIVSQLLENLASIILPTREMGDVLGAPSEARLCQLAADDGPGSLGEAPGTECCVGAGNGAGEAYTGR